MLVTLEYGFVCKRCQVMQYLFVRFIFMNISVQQNTPSNYRAARRVHSKVLQCQGCEKDKEYQCCFLYYLYKFTLSLEFCTTEVTPDSRSTPKILFCHSLRTRPLGPYFATKRTWIFLSRALYTCYNTPQLYFLLSWPGQPTVLPFQWHPQYFLACRRQLQGGHRTCQPEFPWSSVKRGTRKNKIK